jgi:CheY-like chemotaxis protein
MAEQTTQRRAEGDSTSRQPEILAVDDDPVVRRLLDLALRQQGFAVHLAGSGHEAVELYERHRARIVMVLLDVCMAPMDGPATLIALRQVDPSVPVVFMSGHTGIYTQSELQAMGVPFLLQKPFQNLADLIPPCARADRAEQTAAVCE